MSMCVLSAQNKVEQQHCSLQGKRLVYKTGKLQSTLPSNIA
jgi:hypothetical protein